MALICPTRVLVSVRFLVFIKYFVSPITYFFRYNFFIDLTSRRIYSDFTFIHLTLIKNKILFWSGIKNLEKAMAPHSSTLAWKIPWTEEPGRLQSMGSLGVGHD